MLSKIPRGATLFRDDEAGFWTWLDEHPDGYFLNVERKPRPSFLVLHQPGCPHFTMREYRRTKDYVKVCSTSRATLEQWAADVVGGEPTLCRSCFG